MKKAYKITDLIVGKYFDQLTEDQSAELNSWLNESKENQILMNELLDKQGLQFSYKTYEQDPKTNWEAVRKKLTTRQRVRKLHVVLQYAAILIIPLCFAIFYNKLAYQPIENNVAHTITPGSTKAVLLLSDGSSVDLTNGNTENIDEYNGTKISKSNNKLLYTQSEPKDGELIEKYNTIKVPRGGEYQLVLSDGTKVWLNSETELYYPVQFIRNTREIKLSGEAYFEVAKNTGKPFIVSFEDEKIEVLGTSFNVKCYADEINYQTTLVEGKVKYQNPSNELILSPNKQVEFNKQTKNLELKQVNSYDYIAWINGRFIFTNQRLETIFTSLSRWYNVEIIYQNENVKDIRFTGKLKRYDRIEQILEILEATKKIEIIANNNSLTVKPI